MSKVVKWYCAFVFVCPILGLVINSISISETFCVTGSDDGFLRLWPLDFAHVYLEAGEKQKK